MVLLSCAYKWTVTLSNSESKMQQQQQLHQLLMKGRRDG